MKEERQIIARAVLKPRCKDCKYYNTDWVVIGDSGYCDNKDIWIDENFLSSILVKADFGCIYWESE